MGVRYRYARGHLAGNVRHGALCHRAQADQGSSGVDAAQLHRDVRFCHIPLMRSRRSRVVIAHEEITTRKLAEQTLQKSEEKFRQLAENIREVFWMMSPAGEEILYVSPAYEQVWGRSCAKLYRNPMAWAEAIHPDDLQSAHALFARQMQGENIASEYRIRTPDGRSEEHTSE